MRAVHRILINRDHARLWYGQAISSVGDYVFSTTLVLWVATVLAKDQSWAPVAVSGVIMAMGLGVLLVGPLAGVFVDRWNSLRTMLGTEVIRGALVLLLVVASLLPADTLPIWAWLTLIYTVVFALNVAGQFFRPARLTVIRDIVTGDADRARAAGIAQATAGAAAMIGPPLAAPLLFTIGLQWALIFNALSYAVSYVAIRSVRLIDDQDDHEAAPAVRASVRAEFVAGVQFFARSRFLVALLVIAVIGQFGTGALNTLNVFFLIENLRASPELYGYVGTAMGIGGVAGALCAGRVVQWIGAKPTAWISAVVGGALVIVYSRQTSFVSGLVLIVVLTVPIFMLNTALTPLLLAAAPKRFLGRVVAVFFPVTQLASMLAALLAGWLAGSVLPSIDVSVGGIHFGTIDLIFAAAGLLIVLAGIFAWVALPESVSEPEPEREPQPVPVPGSGSEPVPGSGSEPARGPVPEPAVSQRRSPS